MTVSPDLAVNLTNLNFQSSGGVSSDDAHLHGTLQVEQVAVAFQGKHIQLPLVVKFDTAIHLPTQHFDLKQLTIESDPALRLTLSGTINEFITQKAVNLSLSNTDLDLGKIMALAKDFVPPEFGTASIGKPFSLIHPHRLTSRLRVSGDHPRGIRRKKCRTALSRTHTDRGTDRSDIHRQGSSDQGERPLDGKRFGETFYS